MVNAVINWSLTAVTMNFERIIAIINLNQWFITEVMWSFLLIVSEQEELVFELIRGST